MKSFRSIVIQYVDLVKRRPLDVEKCKVHAKAYKVAISLHLLFAAPVMVDSIITVSMVRRLVERKGLQTTPKRAMSGDFYQ